MSHDQEPQEQTIVALFGATLASACAQPAVLLICPTWTGASRAAALLLLMAVFLALVRKNPKITWGSSRHALSRFAGLVIRHRFPLLVATTALIVAQSAWPPSWRPFSASQTRLVIVFRPDSREPAELSSVNVHWAHWIGMQGRARADLRPQDFERIENVQDVTIIFLHFDVPLDCDDLVLSMADRSAVRHETTVHKEDRTALIVVHGRVREDVEMTIEPAPAVVRRI